MVPDSVKLTPGVASAVEFTDGVEVPELPRGAALLPLEPPVAPDVTLPIAVGPAVCRVDPESLG